MSTKPAKRSRKYFTPAEANAALPLVQAIVRDIADLAQDLRERQERLHGRVKAERGARGEAYREELKPIQEELERKKERLMECAKELENLGVELKDPNTGLVDFPAMMDGHEVYLCWRLGESKVAFWHEIEAGVARRQKLILKPPKKLGVSFLTPIVAYLLFLFGACAVFLLPLPMLGAILRP